MSIWNSPFEKYEIEKSAQKKGFKVFLSNMHSEIIKIIRIKSWVLIWNVYNI